jgi:DtxR family Mn-dependent transcriptional regulator
MVPTTVSSVTEEYLEAIYRLQEKSGVARTSELAEMLNVAPGTITNTVERLERQSLIIHEPYRGVRLTEKGRGIALRMVRKHRLSERLLTDILNVEWDKAHDAACQLEHGISDEIAKRIEKVLGHPKTCPHGNPVPTECGGIIEENSLPLAEISPGEKGVIVKIAEESPELLQYLETMGLKPETFLEVVQKAPFGGPITVRVDGKDHALSRTVAGSIGVRVIDE